MIEFFGCFIFAYFALYLLLPVYGLLVNVWEWQAARAHQRKMELAGLVSKSEEE